MRSITNLVRFRLVAGMLLCTTWIGCTEDKDNPSADTSGGDADSDTDADVDSDPVEEGDLFVNHSDIDITQISDTAVERAKQNLHIVYQHTSHGSQLITGMNSLADYSKYENQFNWSDSGETGALDLDDNGIPGADDLSQGDQEDENGDTPWVVAARELLDNPDNSHVNVVMWSWCSINGHDAQRYVDNMEKLIAEYPEITFVFMTGHSEGTGEDLSPNGVHYNNQLIRTHCLEHKRWLFDFADIEAHDPEGNYYWDKNLYDNLNYEDGNWAVEWIANNPNEDYAIITSQTSGCAHSDDPQEANLNCVLKGAAAWHLFTRIAEQRN